MDHDQIILNFTSRLQKIMDDLVEYRDNNEEVDPECKIDDCGNHLDSALDCLGELHDSLD